MNSVLQFLTPKLIISNLGFYIAKEMLFTYGFFFINLFNNLIRSKDKSNLLLMVFMCASNHKSQLFCHSIRD